MPENGLPEVAACSMKSTLERKHGRRLWFGWIDMATSTSVWFDNLAERDEILRPAPMRQSAAFIYFGA
jgi:hypothetical protein